MEETRPSMLDMEEKLEKDIDGAYKKDLTDHLSEFSLHIKRALDKGLAPDQFKAADKLKSAADAASAVVEKVWSSTHCK